MPARYEYVSPATPFNSLTDLSSLPSTLGKVSPALPVGVIGPDQSLRRKSHWQIFVDGKDVTNALDPYLISVHVIDRIANETGFDMCMLELDDRNAQLAIPREGSRVEVWFGWESQGPRVGPTPPEVVNPFTGVAAKAIELPFQGSMYNMFIGYIQQVESGCSRSGGGRRMWIEASSLIPGTNAKTQRTMTMGDGDPPGLGKTGSGGSIPFSEFAQKVVSSAGPFNANVGSSMAGIKRNFWAVDGASALHYMSQMAKELGGALKVSGNTFHFVGAGDVAAGEVLAVWGYNLIGWRIKPFLERPQFQRGRSQFFERAKGQVKDVITQWGGAGGPFGGATAQQQLPGQSASPQMGQQENEGAREGGMTDRGVGWVTINGEPSAIAIAGLTLLGARPGVDGRYRIKEAEHIYSRQGGWITRCELDTPISHFGGYQDWGGQQSIIASRQESLERGGFFFDPYTLTDEQIEWLYKNMDSTSVQPSIPPTNLMTI